MKSGAELDKRDIDGHLAIDLAPDSKVNSERSSLEARSAYIPQIRKYIIQTAEREGIELP